MERVKKSFTYMEEEGMKLTSKGENVKANHHQQMGWEMLKSQYSQDLHLLRYIAHIGDYTIFANILIFCQLDLLIIDIITFDSRLHDFKLNCHIIKKHTGNIKLWLIPASALPILHIRILRDEWHLCTHDHQDRLN
jgi:hypothetical protein